MSAPDSKSVLTASASRTLRVLAFIAAISGPAFWAGNAYAANGLEAQASRLERVESKLDDLAQRLSRIEGRLSGRAP